MQELVIKAIINTHGELGGVPCNTRRASRAAASRCLLLALRHDELGVIVDGLADPFQPVVAVALSSTCKGLRTPLRAALEALWQLHERAKALCRRMSRRTHLEQDDSICAELPRKVRLAWHQRGLKADDMPTLAMLLPWMPRLEELQLGSNKEVGDAGLQALFEGLGHGALPSLRILALCEIQLGPAGAEVLAAALRRGAMRNVEMMQLSHNRLGNQGVASLVADLG